MQTTYRKSCPATLLQVSNLIFDPCFKVQLGHHIEVAFYLPFYCSLGLESYFMVRLPPFLLNTRQEKNTVAVMLFFMKYQPVVFA